jgi:hypothetical protein
MNFSRKLREFSLTAALTISISITPPDARAQDAGALFLGIIGAAIQDSQRQQAERQRQQQQQRAAQAQRNAERQAEIAIVRRIQAALAQMGYYSMAIDGSAGPGTQAAIRAYVTAFGVAQFAFQEQEVQQLERHARLGFPDIRTERLAISNGFSDHREYSTASRAGFARAGDFREAQRLNISSFTEFSAYRSSGFPNVQEFRAARAQGFANSNEARTARAAGFDRADEYRAFLASGLATRQEFQALQAARSRVARSRATCLSERPDVAVEERLLSCAEAVDADRSDLTAVQRLSAAITQAGVSGTAPERLELLVATVDCITGPPRIEGDRRAGACLRAAGGLSDPAITAMMSERLRQTFTSELRRAETEQLQLDAEAAREEGRQLIAELADFLASGRRFARGAEVVRATTSLQSMLNGQDARQLIQSVETLAGLTNEDPGFAAFRADRIEAERLAIARALEGANDDVNRYTKFIENFLIENMFDARASELLALFDLAADSLVSENSEHLLAARDVLVERLRGLGLLEAAESYQPPDNSEVSLSREPLSVASVLLADISMQRQVVRDAGDGGGQALSTQQFPCDADQLSAGCVQCLVQLDSSTVGASGQSSLCSSQALPTPFGSEQLTCPQRFVDVASLVERIRADVRVARVANQTTELQLEPFRASGENCEVFPFESYESMQSRMLAPVEGATHAEDALVCLQTFVERIRESMLTTENRGSERLLRLLTDATDQIIRVDQINADIPAEGQRRNGILRRLTSGYEICSL